VSRVVPAEVQAKLVEAFNLGETSTAIACAYAGIAETTLEGWLERGRAGEDGFREFADAVERAKAQAVIVNRAVMRKAAQAGHWQAAAWWLDRVMPDRASAPTPPPRTGKGSSRKAWSECAVALGHQVTEELSRAQLIALVESGPAPGPNRAALEIQIEAMATGREHRAQLQACRALADQVDAMRVYDEKVWREYRLALRDLREAVADGGTDPDADIPGELRATFRNPTDTE
jgi:hypothetical protein